MRVLKGGGGGKGVRSDRREAAGVLKELGGLPASLGAVKDRGVPRMGGGPHTAPFPPQGSST